jgi:hypothetical protein
LAGTSDERRLIWDHLLELGIDLKVIGEEVSPSHLVSRGSNSFA